jgi:hypothetical protein
MTPVVQTYKPGDVVLEIAQFIVTDWDSITIHQNSDAFNFIKGIRGVNTRTRSYDTSLTISIDIGGGSITNDVFTEIVRLDREFGTGRCFLSLTDVSGTTQIRSDNAYIKSLPDISVSKDVGTNKWEIICLDSFSSSIGGNNNSLISLFTK